METAWIPRDRGVASACSVFTSLPWETFFVRNSSSKFPKCYFYQPKPLESYMQNPPAHLHSRQSLGKTCCFEFSDLAYWSFSYAMVNRIPVVSPFSQNWCQHMKIIFLIPAVQNSLKMTREKTSQTQPPQALYGPIQCISIPVRIKHQCYGNTGTPVEGITKFTKLMWAMCTLYKKQGTWSNCNIWIQKYLGRL